MDDKTQSPQVTAGQGLDVSIGPDGEPLLKPRQFKTVPLDAAKLAKATKRFEWLVNFLICRYHFVHRTLGSMRKTAENRIPTMGVSVTGEMKVHLAYNLEWFMALKDPEAVYVFNHEVDHVLLHHCTTRKMDTSELANIAQDLAVNELIREIPDICMRPRDENGQLIGCFVSEYKKQPEFADIEERKTAEWYYEYLKKKAKEGKGGKLGTRFDDHSGHKESEIADERVRALVREIEANNMWGSIDGMAKEMILAAQTRHVNWRSRLCALVGNRCAKTKTTTRFKPNRRFGWDAPGYKRGYEGAWLVAADTSGSTWCDRLLEQFLNVVNQIHEEGVPVDFMQFDCKTQEMPRPFDRQHTKLEFKGCGGTSFEPGITLAEEKHYQGIIFLTDGAADAPHKPRNIHVIWVLPKGNHPPVEWGDRVYIERTGA